MATKKNIIIEKVMQELTSVNYRYNLRLPIIYRYNNLLVIGQTTIEQNKELESMGATIRKSDLGHNFLCLRYSKDMQSRLHYWRNEKARQARQEDLGSGWHYADYDHQAQPGDRIVCVGGTTGICTRGGTTIHFTSDEDGKDCVVGGYFIDDTAYHRNDHKEDELTDCDDVCITIRISFEHGSRYDAQEARQEAIGRVIGHLQGAYIYEALEGLRISDIENCGENC